MDINKQIALNNNSGSRELELLKGIRAGAYSSPSLTFDEDMMNDTYLPTRINATRAFLNAIDEIDISRDKGYNDELEYKIKTLEKYTLSNPNATEAERVEAEYQIDQYRKEQGKYADRIAKNKSNIAYNVIDKNYLANADKYLDEENSSVTNWLKYEAPQDLGGSASEAGTQLALAFGPGIVKYVLTVYIVFPIRCNVA